MTAVYKNYTIRYVYQAKYFTSKRVREMSGRQNMRNSHIISLSS